MIQHGTFSIDSEGINPGAVPFRELGSGSSMPAIGVGTFGSDHASSQEVAQAVRGALACGYRHLDCASVYGNEKEIGEVLKDVFSVISRDELWINSKVWNDAHQQNALRVSCERSINDLGCDYVDLYFVHWPFPNFHPPHCSVDSRSPDAKPFSLDRFMSTWQAMEKLVDDGLVRHIGVSNFTIPKFEAVLPHCRIRPSANEMELHPLFQQPELYDYCVAKGMTVIGYCPIGSPARPKRDRTSEDLADTEDPTVVEIAQQHGLHPASVCVKWAQQRGQVPIPFSTKRPNYLANLQAVCSEPFSDQEMEQLAAIDRNCRLIKGQVFLWEGATSWQDLWDPDGHIAA